MRAVAEQAIRTAVRTKDNPADLINVALEELVRAWWELPGYTHAGRDDRWLTVRMCPPVPGCSDSMRTRCRCCPGSDPLDCSGWVGVRWEGLVSSAITRA